MVLKTMTIRPLQYSDCCSMSQGRLVKLNGDIGKLNCYLVNIGTVLESSRLRDEVDRLFHRISSDFMHSKRIFLPKSGNIHTDTEDNNNDDRSKITQDLKNKDKLLTIYLSLLDYFKMLLHRTMDVLWQEAEYDDETPQCFVRAGVQCQPIFVDKHIRKKRAATATAKDKAKKPIVGADDKEATLKMGLFETVSEEIPKIENLFVEIQMEASSLPWAADVVVRVHEAHESPQVATTAQHTRSSRKAVTFEQHTDEEQHLHGGGNLSMGCCARRRPTIAVLLAILIFAALLAAILAVVIVKVVLKQ